jgi:hypothetical protein
MDHLKIIFEYSFTRMIFLDFFRLEFTINAENVSRKEKICGRRSLNNHQIVIISETKSKTNILQ